VRTATLDELSEMFVRLVSIPSPSGEERDMADAVLGFVRGCGLSIVEDGAAERTGCASGNLLARVPGRGHGTPIALCAHLDTVPVDRAPTVVCEDGIAHSDGETVLGADDKAAVAVLLALLRDLAVEPPAADVEVLFTVGEEIGLRGAKAFDLAGLRGEVMFVLDSEGAPGTMIIGAPTL
jgi:tripeptide aminopeptidase